MLRVFLSLFAISLVCIAHAEDGIADAPQIRQAELLIEAGKSEEAYVLLQPLELEQAGNISYDYLLGISALNSDKASQAVFALERVQDSDPEYGEIGLWLSIAYFRAGDLERAKSGFNSVLTTTRNPKTVATANEYLASINQLEANAGSVGNNRAEPVLLGKVEAGIGYDDNISNTSSSYPGASQLSNTLSTPVSYLGGMESILNFGMEGRVPIAGHYAFLSADEGQRRYRGHSIMNSKTRISKGGMNFTSEGGNVYRTNLALRQFRQEGFSETIKDIDNDYDIKGLEGSSKLKLSEYDHLGFLAHLNRLHFYSASQEDTRQVMLGTNYMHIFQTSGSPVFYFGYTNIVDTAMHTKPAYNPAYNNGLTVASRVSRNYTVYLQYSLTRNIDVFFMDYVNFRRDKGAFARDAAVAYGEDRTGFIALGLNWRPWAFWTVGAQVASTSNNSNIALYSYNKTESRVTLKREFSM